MKFTAINISINKWIFENMPSYVIYDEYIYTNKESDFLKNYKDHLFCDGNGKVYKAIKKAEMTESWRNWFSFIPGIWKTKIIFQDMNEKMSIEELRNYLLEKISTLEQNDFTRVFKTEIEKAKTYSELIFKI